MNKKMKNTSFQGKDTKQKKIYSDSNQESLNLKRKDSEKKAPSSDWAYDKGERKKKPISSEKFSRKTSERRNSQSPNSSPRRSWSADRGSETRERSDSSAYQKDRGGRADFSRGASSNSNWKRPEKPDGFKSRTGEPANYRRPRLDNRENVESGKRFPRPIDANSSPRRSWSADRSSETRERSDSSAYQKDRGGRADFSRGASSNSNWKRPEKPDGFKSRTGEPANYRRPRLDNRENVEVENAERIAKRLARAGVSSRREAEELIKSGRIKVNGKLLLSPARNVTLNDCIMLDGQEIAPIEPVRVFLFHKPSGFVSTNRDPEDRSTIFDILPDDLPRLITVGRLDIKTEGLMILTNDGDLARSLEIPSNGWLRRYRVRVHGNVDERRLAELKNGITIKGIFYGPVDVVKEEKGGETNSWLAVSLQEGKNREIRNIMGALELDVSRLIRISFGPFALRDLPKGEIIEIKGNMLKQLIEAYQITEKAETAEPVVSREFRADGRGGSSERMQHSQYKKYNDGRNSKEYPLDKKDTSTRRAGSRFGAEKRDFQTEERGFGFSKTTNFGTNNSERDRYSSTDTCRTVNVWMAPGGRPRKNQDSENLFQKRPRKGSFKPKENLSFIAKEENQENKDSSKKYETSTNPSFAVEKNIEENI